MAQEIINVGTNPNDGTGDTLRGAFVKTDNNFDDLYTNKQNTLISGTNIKTINGNSVLGSGDLTIGGITGSGTTNYVSKFTASGAIGNSIIFDNGTNIGIGNASPTNKLIVDTSVNTADGIISRNLNSGSSAYSFIGTFNNTNNGVDLRSYPSANATYPSTSLISSSSGQTGGLLIMQNGANPIRFNTNGSERMRILSSGNVGIGTSSPSTTLQVVGTFKAGDFSNPSLDVGAAEISANVDSSKIILNSSVAKLGNYAGGPFAVELGVKAEVGARVYFENSIGNKFGLQESDNLLVTDNELIQDTVVPSDTTTPVKWIRINDIAAGNEYLIPVYV